MLKKFISFGICSILALGVPVNMINVNAYNESAPSTTTNSKNLNNARWEDIHAYQNSYTNYYNKQYKNYLTSKSTVSKSEYKTANESLVSLKKEMEKGTKGFFEYMVEQGDTSAKEALKALNDTSSIGNAKTATSIMNLKEGIEIIKDCNKIRAKEKLPELRVSSLLMAQSEVQLNASNNTLKNGKGLAHSQIYNIGENLAFNYAYPFYGWYYAEKDLYRQGNRNMHEIGHYLNIIEDYQYTGASFIYDTMMTGQVFDYHCAGTSYTISQYEKHFNNYMNNVVKAYWKAKAKNDAYYALYYGKTNVAISKLNYRNTSYKKKIYAEVKLVDASTGKAVPNAKVKAKYMFNGASSYSYLKKGTSNKYGIVSLTKKVTIKYKYKKNYSYYINYNKLTGASKKAADMLIKAGLMYKDRPTAVNKQNKDVTANNAQLSSQKYSVKIYPVELPKKYKNFDAVKKKVNGSNKKDYIRIKLKK